jgi:hypothetical protein
MPECPSTHLFGWPPEAPGWAGPLPVASPAGGGGLGAMRPLMYLQTASSGERMCSRMAQKPPPWAWRTMLDALLDCYTVGVRHSGATCSLPGPFRGATSRHVPAIYPGSQTTSSRGKQSWGVVSPLCRMHACTTDMRATQKVVDEMDHA